MSLKDDGKVHSRTVVPIKDKAKLNLNLWEDKTELIYEDSKTAHSFIEDESLDFVYIDGDHSYEGAKSDIELYYSKVKQNGLIAGHDYENEDIIKAVKELLEDKGIEIFSDVDTTDIYKSRDWWCFKPAKIHRPSLRTLVDKKN